MFESLKFNCTYTLAAMQKDAKPQDGIVASLESVLGYLPLS